jgi:hypothetical protein
MEAQRGAGGVGSLICKGVGVLCICGVLGMWGRFGSSWLGMWGRFGSSWLGKGDGGVVGGCSALPFAKDRTPVYLCHSLDQ